MNITATFHPERAEQIIEKIRQSDTPIEHLSYKMKLPELKVDEDVKDDLSDINLDEPSGEEIVEKAADFSSKAEVISDLYRNCDSEKQHRISSKIITNIINKLGYTKSDIALILGTSANSVYLWSIGQNAMSTRSFYDYMTAFLQDGVPYQMLSLTVRSISDDRAAKMREKLKEKRTEKEPVSFESSAFAKKELPEYQFPQDAKMSAEPKVDKSRLRKMFGKLSKQHMDEVIKFMYGRLENDPEFQNIVENYFWEDLK